MAEGGAASGLGERDQTLSTPADQASGPTGTEECLTTFFADEKPNKDSGFHSRHTGDGPRGLDFVPVLICGKADPNSIPTDLLQRLSESGSPLKPTEVFVEGTDAAAANAGHGVIRQAEPVLTNPHYCNIMLRGKCITYDKEDEDKAAEIFPAKESWGVILVQVGVARDEEDPEYMRKFRSVRLPLSDRGELGLTEEVWTRFFADLKTAYDECHEEYLSVPENPAQLVLSFEEDSRPVQEQSLPLPEPAEAAIVPPANARPQAPPVAPQNREVLLKTIRKLYFTLIESDKHNWFDWLNLIRKHMNVLDLNELVKLRNREGETVLHVIVQYLKVDHLQVLFYLGILPKLKDIPIEQNRNSQFAGYIARGIAERYASKARGVRFLESLDRFVSWERSMTRLAKACRSGTESEVKFILQMRKNGLHAKDEQGCSALYWACVGGNETIVKLLINRGVNARHVNKRGESILYAACKLGHSHLIPLLYNECKLDPLQKDILEHIAENGDIKTLDKLRGCNFTIPDFMLPIAAYHCHLRLVEFLLNTCKIDLDYRDETNKTALLRAGDAGSRQLVNYFISNGASIADQDRRKRNILHFLTEHKSNDAMKDVIEKAKAKNLLHDMINVQDMYIGGDLCFLMQGKDSGRRAWHYIEVKRWMVDLFMKKTKRGRVDVQVFGTTIVSGWGMAPRRQDIDQMESVFDQRKRSGQQPLDSTPLHYAAYLENVTMVKMLLAEGADPSIKDSFGQTTMHMACMRGNLQMARLLEDAGAKLDIKDKQGQSPADVAEINENTQLVNYTLGIEYYPAIEEFQKKARKLLEGVESTTLEAERRDDRDVIIALRDMETAIDQALIELGSGPVQEETMPAITVPASAPFSSLSYTRSKAVANIIPRFQHEASKLLNELERTKLEAARRVGKDIKKEVISALRDMEIEIHRMLMDLGCGPIRQDTS